MIPQLPRITPEYILFLILPSLVSGIVSYFSGETGRAEWYLNLRKSPLTPPGWVFGTVWPLLYASIGHVLFQLTRGRGTTGAGAGAAFSNPAAIWLYLNLLLNYSWLFAFNRLRNFELGFWILIAMVVTLLLFMYLNPVRQLSWILLPYLLWSVFAAYLNRYIADYNAN